MRRRVRDGDREVFGQLYEEFARAVFNHALRMTGDRSTAEDVMSETFLTAWRHRTRVREDGGTLLPWLLGIATHKADNARRGAWRRQLFLARQPRQGPVEDFAPQVAGRIDDVRRLRAVQASLGRLRQQEREVLALCVWSGLDYRETAEALGIPVGTVRSRLSRARKKLARLAEEDTERRAAHGEMTSAAALVVVPVRKELT
ncbi:RNA polymerase sigma factor [Streptomyces sp. NPDC008313]|uniref:RNA polymerase sigma factor n=1 Tax=Streptomyces sp. NPDC008313 TaxID=3364826 RepID=UPI0036EAC500